MPGLRALVVLALVVALALAWKLTPLGDYVTQPRALGMRGMADFVTEPARMGQFAYEAPSGAPARPMSMAVQVEDEIDW